MANSKDRQAGAEGNLPTGQAGLNLFYRDIELDERAVDTEGRKVELSFSSETPVRRWFGQEILSHHEGHINLSRLNTLLMNHDPDRIVGPVKSKKIENARGLAVAGFDETDEGELRMKQVQSKSLRGVSVGYIVHKFKKLEPDEEWALADGKTLKGGKEDNPTYIATKWEPIEISLTPIPADSSVGIGREATRSLEGIEIEQQKAAKTEEEPPPGDTGTGERSTEGGPDMDPKELEAALAKRDQDHRDGLKRLFDRASAVGQETLVFKLITEGKDEREITDALFEAMGKERGKPGDGGEGTRGADDLKLEGVDDDTLTRGLTNPTLVTLD